MAIRSTRDLPFAEQAGAALLGIVPGRVEVDTEYEGFGWARVPRLTLETIDSEVAPIELEQVTVIALHSAEEDESPDGDIDLELRALGETLIVSLRTFLAAWAPSLPTTRHWVLALCNPRQRRLLRMAEVPTGVSLWYGMGDVDAFGEPDATGNAVLGLTASSWNCI